MARVSLNYAVKVIRGEGRGQTAEDGSSLVSGSSRVSSAVYR